MKTVIIDYGSGNLQPVFDALSSLNLGHEILISARPEILKTATHLVLLGTGAFDSCMQGLKSVEGLAEALHRQAMVEKKPLLGIGVGMQILASKGYENEESAGLGFIDGKVVKIENTKDLKIPHKGLSPLLIRPEQVAHPMLKGIKNGDEAYFANCFHFLCQNEGNVLAQIEYGAKQNVVIAKKNIVGIQFHPEKSGEMGAQIMKNFLNWRY